MRNRIISTILIAIILVIANSNTVSAHPNSQKGILAESYFSVENYHGYFVGGEEVGWALAEDNHTNGTTLTYYFAQNNDNLTNAMKNYTQAGATWWNGVVTITRITEAQIDADPTICNPDYYPSGIGVITTDSLSSTSRFAEFRPTNVDSLGHLKEWSIAINVNTASNLNAKIMAHEFGHAIGLTDLYSLDNRDKLMYGYPNSGTATSLNALDIWGQKLLQVHIRLILGITNIMIRITRGIYTSSTVHNAGDYL